MITCYKTSGIYDCKKKLKDQILHARQFINSAVWKTATAVKSTYSFLVSKNDDIYSSRWYQWLSPQSSIFLYISCSVYGISPSLRPQFQHIF